ncbi:hypothetical protein [Paenibacillus donghaensis]|uniref:Uncharacterized protein n=1 Tax=Paenibacillus donghaensis TaxID=414771 RepID=A0A2Z2K3X6_9BACL|nr:hypothetical protein [Paenibacillus donghaensis]ASA20276.1 hypothetical protein B9T62_05365 [Paenibacillus donghaensis]
MNLTVVVIALMLWIVYKKGSNGLPSWLVKTIGVFLIIMLIRNLGEVYQFVFVESDAWWPLVKENGARFSENLRSLLRKMMEGGAES